MASPAVSISILANANQAVSEIESLARATNSTEDRLDAAGRAAGRLSSGIDFIGGSAAKLAGGLGDVADGLAKNGIISEEAAEKADQVAKGMMIVAGAADIATTAAALHAAAMQAGGIAAAKNAVATVASNVATTASSVATKAAAAGQWLLNAAMAANPIGLIVIAVIALAAGLVLLWQKSETFRRIVLGAWDAVKKGVQLAIDGIVKYISFVLNMYQKVFNFGRDIVRGLVDGIQSAVQWVKDKVKAVANIIPSSFRKLLGISSPSKVMADLGKHTMRGLTGGIDSQIPALKRSMRNVSNVVSGLDTSLTAGSVELTGSASSRFGSSTTYAINVTVAPGADPAETGRKVVETIRAFERRSNRRVLANAL